MTRCDSSARIHLVLAGIAHLVERHLAKVEVASSSLVARSSLMPTHQCVGIKIKKINVDFLKETAYNINVPHGDIAKW